jgi:hypothetical protein
MLKGDCWLWILRKFNFNKKQNKKLLIILIYINLAKKNNRKEATYT